MNKLVIGFLTISMLLAVACNSGTEALAESKAKSIGEIEEFIKSNPSDGELEKAIVIRDSLIFDSISKVNTIEAFEFFVQNYPESGLIGLAKEKIKELSGIQLVVPSFRGGEARNYYGNYAPSNLDENWKLSLGSGRSFAYGKMYVWTGAGWTGQPLVVVDKNVTYLIQGAFDYHLRKINAQTGEVIWKYKFDDILKGTGTVFINKNARTEEERVVVMQGSRRGEVGNSAVAPSFRGVSFLTGKELWRMNSEKTASYSRDVDGSALGVGDTAYIGLENGLFTVFNPDPQFAEMKTGMLQPKIYKQLPLYTEKDKSTHGGNLVTESSPTLLGDRIFSTTGSGHVYGYNMKTGKLDWDFYIGADMDGTPPATDDNCLIITVEKEYIAGKGGVYKLNPSKTGDEAVEWFFPTENKTYFTWAGGIIGSAAVNDAYVGENEPHLAVFSGIDGNLYVVNHQKLATEKVVGTDAKTMYPTPELVFKKNVGPTISSPIIVGNKIIVATYTGLYLFEHDKDLKFKQLAFMKGTFEASPIVWNGKIYIASNSSGFLYCLGK